MQTPNTPIQTLPFQRRQQLDEGKELKKSF